MKRVFITGFLVMLLFSFALAAQRRGFGISPSPQFHHGGGYGGYGGYYGHSIQPIYYEPLYSSYAYNAYNAPFYNSLYYPSTQILTPAPQSSHGGPMIIVVQAPQPTEQRVIYIPSWQRPNPGPSLGEIARSLGARAHKHPVDKGIEE